MSFPNIEWPKESKRLKKLQNIFLVYIVVYTLWPTYINYSIGSLPGINPAKILLVVLVIYFFIYRISVSKLKRLTIPDKIILGSLFVWNTLYIISSITANESLSFLNNLSYQFMQSFLMIIIGLVVLTENFLKRMSKTLMHLMFVISLIGVIEFILKRNLFSYIFVPNTIYAQQAMFPPHKTEYYRIYSTFSNSLNLVQFYILIIPILMYVRKVGCKFSFTNKLEIFFSVMISLLTFSRALILVYGIYIIMFFLLKKGNIIKNLSIKVFYVSLGLLFVGMLLQGENISLSNLSLEFRNQSMSYEQSTRYVQIVLAIPLIQARPYWGYGMNEAAGILNYASQDGTPTVDNYFLTLALEVGFIGLSVYLVFLVLILGKSLKVSIYLFAGVIGFILQLTTLSTTECHVYFYMLVAIVLSRSINSEIRHGDRFSKL